MSTDKLNKSTTKPSMTDVIESGLTGIHGTSNVLAALWRLLLYQSNLKPHHWHRLVDGWRTQLSMSEMTEKELISIRGNISRVLAKDKISWTQLIRGFTILGWEKMDIQITLHKGNKKKVLNATVDNLLEVVTSKRK